MAVSWLSESQAVSHGSLTGPPSSVTAYICELLFFGKYDVMQFILIFFSIQVILVSLGLKKKEKQWPFWILFQRAWSQGITASMRIGDWYGSTCLFVKFFLAVWFKTLSFMLCESLFYWQSKTGEWSNPTANLGTIIGHPKTYTCLLSEQKKNHK